MQGPTWIFWGNLTPSSLQVLQKPRGSKSWLAGADAREGPRAVRAEERHAEGDRVPGGGVSGGYLGSMGIPVESARFWGLI
jgi:hypothetical protein